MVSDDSTRGPVSPHQDEFALRERAEELQQRLRQRFDVPLSRATEISRRTKALFPVRVWQQFSRNNGFLLAAGISYQALFAVFAAIYVAFAIVGLWLGGNQEAITALIDVVNHYVPGLIGDDSAPFSVEDVRAIAEGGTSVFSITGAIALVTLVWTAIGFVTYTRRAVRDMFGLPYDTRSPILLKARDFLAAVIFGIVLVVGSLLSAIATWALSIIFTVVGLNTHSPLFDGSLRAGTLIVAFALNTLALAALVRFLSGTNLRWRIIWPGALLGGAGLAVLQIAAGLLVRYTPSNPLLATFALFVGLLLWFRGTGIVILIAVAWIATAAKDADIPLQPLTEQERAVQEHHALLLAAQVRLRNANAERASAPWYRHRAADRAVHSAERELAEIQASAPPAPKSGVRPTTTPSVS